MCKNGGCRPLSTQTAWRRPEATLQEAGSLGAGAARVLPTTPRLPYDPNPVTYTHIWVAKRSGTGATELPKECDSYCDAFTGNPVEYVDIITPLLATSNGMVFLKLLVGDQVYTLHLIGRFIYGIVKHTPAHNRIFGILVENVGDQLPPIYMVPEAGLVSWFQME